MMASTTTATIGDRNLVYMNNFIVPDNEEATLSLDVRVGAGPILSGIVGYNLHFPITRMN
jgi:hypothetical protein